MNSRPHGIMFHHFHNDKHIVGQGSISAEQFSDCLDYYSKKHNIINADEFLFKSEKGTLKPEDVCLTFDDGLLCQYDIAFPVLKDRGVTGFWFVYTSPIDGIKEKVEIYRHFRFSVFSDVEEFYNAFFKIASSKNEFEYEQLKKYNPDKHYIDYPFYTPNDKRFRYMRDALLGPEKYNSLMDNMIDEYGYDVEEKSKILWIKENQIKELYQAGNIIGLHSYTHPTVMINKSYEQQFEEYLKNKKELEEIINSRVSSVSYPCNSYNSDTLRCMRELGVKIGFRANMADVCFEESRLEYSREDHANIIKEMEENK